VGAAIQANPPPGSGARLVKRHPELTLWRHEELT
jgi:hypothetical protein